MEIKETKYSFLIPRKILQKYDMIIYMMRRIQRYFIFDTRFDSFQEIAPQNQKNSHFPML